MAVITATPTNLSADETEDMTFSFVSYRGYLRGCKPGVKYSYEMQDGCEWEWAEWDTCGGMTDETVLEVLKRLVEALDRLDVDATTGRAFF